MKIMYDTVYTPGSIWLQGIEKIHIFWSNIFTILG